MKCFVRVAEVWVPSADGLLLELSGGLFEAAPRFGAATRGMCFGRAEGLPGRAWTDGRPLLLKRFEGSYFRRTAAAQTAGLRCAVALPIFLREQLTSVVVLLCGDDDAQRGAIELWHNDPRVATDLKLADGYFGATAPAFEDLTRDSYLSRGSGLPGLAWQQESAVFAQDLGTDKHFLRAQAARSAGVVRGLAFPCGTLVRESWVIALLASADTPLAKRIESWRTVGDALPTSHGTLQRAFGHCESSGTLPTGASTARPAGALGAVGRAALSGVAQATGGDEAYGTALADEARNAGLSTLLAIPIVSDDVVREVVALHF